MVERNRLKFQFSSMNILTLTVIQYVFEECLNHEGIILLNISHMMVVLCPALRLKALVLIACDMQNRDQKHYTEFHLFPQKISPVPQKKIV